MPEMSTEPEKAPAESKPVLTDNTLKDNILKDNVVETKHRITLGGQQIAYTVTTGTIVLKEESEKKGEKAGEAEGEKPKASVLFIAYTRDDVLDRASRPLTFSFNGGPGSSSVWLHLGVLGPRRVLMGDAGSLLPPPYRLVDNEQTWLDMTDLVFIDPVGTGYSKPLGKTPAAAFWGVDEDVKSIAQFIRRYLSETGRWNSPRYLMGESYGTTRSAALVNALQDDDHMDFNGVILMSAVLDFATISFGAGNPLPYILYLPSYAAVAWYHQALPRQPPELRAFLREVEHFATTDYALALLAGSKLDSATRARVLDRLHQYTGLSREYLDRADLRVDNGQFQKELMRERGIAVGRLDARYTGPTFDPLAERVNYDPQSADINSAFASAWNDYVHNELNFGRDRDYVVLGKVQPWNWTHGERRVWPGYANVATDLAQAMQLNPHLRVLLNSGLFDLATPYFAAEFTMDHLQLPPSLRDHIVIAEYDAGHMMYVNPPSLVKLRENMVAFITGGAAPVAAERPAARPTATR